MDPALAAGLTGMVVDMDTGKPVAGATVALHAEPDGRLGSGTVTGETGGFRIPSVSPGRYVLRIRRIGYRIHDQPRTLTAGRADTLRVVLEVSRFYNGSPGTERVEEPAERTAIWEAALRYLRQPQDSAGEGLDPLVLLADREREEFSFDQDWLATLVARNVVDGVCVAASAFACPDTVTSYFASPGQPFRVPRGFVVVDISLTFVRPDYCRQARAQGLTALYAIQEHQLRLRLRAGRWQVEPGDWMHFSIGCSE
jgi:hypothetical protein